MISICLMALTGNCGYVLQISCTLKCCLVTPVLAVQYVPCTFYCIWSLHCSTA